MAFSAVTERGSATERVQDASLAMSPSGNITVGKIAFIYAPWDNGGAATAAGATTTHDTLADTDGNTWTQVFERTQATSAVRDGVTHSLWWALVGTQIDTGDSITLTADNTDAQAKVLMAFEVTVGSGNTVQVAGTTQFLETASTNPAALTISGLPSKEYLYIGVLAVEDEFVGWTESTSDAFTNVFAAEGITSGPTGGSATNTAGFIGYRIATGTGATFDVAYPGGTGTPDMALALVAFEEVTPGGGTQALSGSLFSSTPTFFTGTVGRGAVALTGTLFQSTPTFNTGAVASNYPLAGTLFQSTPTFFTGAITVGAVNLAGTLFQSTPTFPQGAVTNEGGTQALTGTLFTSAPTFFTGAITATYALSGTLFTSTPTFFAGTVASTATRLYLGGLDASPRFYVDPVSYGAQWENTDNAANSTRRVWRDKPGYGFDQISRVKSPASDTADRLMSILVSNPLAAQTITGTAKAVARVSENAVGSDLRSQIVIRVMSDDLQTERGVLYAGDDGALATEWSTTVTNRYFPQSGSATLSSVAAQDGDRLLVELGYRSHAAGTSGSGTIDLGDAASDLPDNESNTTQGAPWIEFSQDIQFKAFAHGTTLHSEAFTGTNGDPWPAEWTTNAIGVDSAIDINTNAGRAKAGTASTSDAGQAILDASTINVTDADVYFRFRYDSLEPVSGSPSGAVVGLLWLRGDGTWRGGAGVTDRPVDNGVGFEFWNNRPGTKIVEIFEGTVFHPSTDFECEIRQPVDTADTWTRLRLEGTYGAMKMWQGVIGDEPLDWQIETHAVQVVGPGQVQIVAKRDNSNGTVITSMFVDDLDIGDAGAGFEIAGTLFQSTPTFFTGAITVGAVNLAGTLFQSTPTFFAGTVTSGAFDLVGTLFESTPTFPTGTVTTGAVALTGTLFQSTPSFFAGTVTVGAAALTGTLFENTPTFFTGTILTAGGLVGVLFESTPTFFTGVVVADTTGAFWTYNPAAYTLNPAAYDPVGPNDIPPWGFDIFGTLFQSTPTFHVGAIS